MVLPKHPGLYGFFNFVKLDNFAAAAISGVATPD